MPCNRIVVISDTHGDFMTLKKIIDKYMHEATYFIHLGDGQDEIEKIKDRYPMLKLLTVRGNCDYCCNFPLFDEIVVGGKKIVFTHGHKYYINYDYNSLLEFAKSKDADIVLYGHLHAVCDTYVDNIHIFSPGSPSQARDGKPSFGIIDISSAGIVTNIVSVKTLLK